MKNDIYIKNGIVIPEHELVISASRAGGPGGQHVNKTSTRITIRWNLFKTKALTETQQKRVADKLQAELTQDGDLVVHNGSTRSQLQNRKLALAQLAAKLRKALHKPKKRLKSNVPRGVKEQRLQAKKMRGRIKKLRSKKVLDA